MSFPLRFDRTLAIMKAVNAPHDEHSPMKGSLCMKHVHRAAALAVLSASVVGALALAASPASAATGWNVVDDDGVVRATLSIDPADADRVTLCDQQADGLDAVVEYYTATNTAVQRRSTTFPGTCTVGFAPGETIVAVRGAVGPWTTGWQQVG
jgi:hypothetical protein